MQLQKAKAKDAERRFSDPVYIETNSQKIERIRSLRDKLLTMTIEEITKSDED